MDCIQFCDNFVVYRLVFSFFSLFSGDGQEVKNESALLPMILYFSFITSLSMLSFLKHSTFLCVPVSRSGYPSPGIGFHDSDASFSFLLNVKLNNNSLSFQLYVARNESRSCRSLARRKIFLLAIETVQRFSILITHIEF